MHQPLIHLVLASEPRWLTSLIQYGKYIYAYLKSINNDNDFSNETNEVTMVT